MSNLLDIEGVFRARPVECAVKPTGKSGYPQFIVRYQIVEIYDESAEPPEFIEWDHDQYITGFHVLFTNDKALFHYEDVMKAFGWDGQKFDDLQSADYSETTVLIRCAEEEWEGKTRLKVKSVDEPDANPLGGSLSPMDPAELKTLNTQYAHLMVKKTVTPAKPGKKATKKKPAAKKAAPPTRAPKPVEAEVADGVGEGVTKETAWNDLYDQVPKDLEDRDTVIGNAFMDATDEVAEGIDDEDITNEQWEEIRDRTLVLLNG